MSYNPYVELVNHGRVTNHIMTRGEVTITAMNARQEARNHAVRLNVQLEEAVYDLETQLRDNRNNVDARFDELMTAANNCENLLRENQSEVHNAHKRGVNTVVVLLCLVTCLVTCVGMNFGWVFYMEAVAEQARAEAMAEQARAATARVAYLKELWLVKAYFQRDWVMTVAWAEYYHFKAWVS